MRNEVLKITVQSHPVRGLKLLKIWRLHAALFGIYYFCNIYIERRAVRHIVRVLQTNLDDAGDAGDVM
jgi:hypothetical protein